MADLNVFPHFPSVLDLRAKEFQANRAGWDLVLNKFQEALKVCAGEGAARALQSHQTRGQLLGE